MVFILLLHILASQSVQLIASTAGHKSPQVLYRHLGYLQSLFSLQQHLAIGHTVFPEIRSPLQDKSATMAIGLAIQVTSTIPL